MGTNYYTKVKKCKSCGHQPGGIHLGKSSGGWKFSFQYNGGQYYKNVEEMKEWLKDKIIVDEYGKNVKHKDFWSMVEQKQKEPLSHAEYVKAEYPLSASEHEHVIDGYSFSDVEFS